MSSKGYDCIVVGAGVEGSATAYQLSRVGKKTLLIEQFPLLHSDGSSHGLSRLTRRAYEFDCFAMLLDESQKEWRELERVSGESIYLKTGTIQMAKNNIELQETAIELLKKHNAPYTPLNSKKMVQLYPHMKGYEDYNVLNDEDGGVIRADKGLAAYQKIFQQNGGEIVDNCTVKEVHPGSTVTVETTKGNFTAKAVVFCLGTWAGVFLESKLGLKVPIQPQRPYFMYWKEKEQGSFSIDKGIPCFMDIDQDIYGFPSVEYPGLVKICFDGGLNFDLNIEGDDDKPPAKLDELCEYVRDHFPGLVPHPEIMGKCKYATSPDHKFYLDKHPKYPNIVIGAGFSGKGFKFSPAVGNILRDLALGAKSKYDLSAFSISRFSRA